MFSSDWLKITHISLFDLVQCPTERLFCSFPIWHKEGMVFSPLFLTFALSSYHTVPIHAEVSFPGLIIPQHITYAHTYMPQKQQTTSAWSKTTSEKKTFLSLLIDVTTVVNLAEVLCVRGLTSATSIHQTMEVFPGSAKEYAVHHHSLYNKPAV